jgi:AcrR family transcriptional regulator
MVTARSEDTKRRLVDAARDVLIEDGFASASARVIATRAGVNQALVFYHYGGVESLLLAALDASSEVRLAAYSEAVDSAGSIPGLIERLEALFAEDVASGHMTLVTELVGAGLSRPDLREQVTARAEPWRALTQRAANRYLAGTPFESAADEIASLVVALGLGANLLARLESANVELPKLRQLASLFQ